MDDSAQLSPGCSSRRTHARPAIDRRRNRRSIPCQTFQRSRTGQFCAIAGSPDDTTESIRIRFGTGGLLRPYQVQRHCSCDDHLLPQFTLGKTFFVWGDFTESTNFRCFPNQVLGSGHLPNAHSSAEPASTWLFGFSLSCDCFNSSSPCFGHESQKSSAQSREPKTC